MELTVFNVKRLLKTLYGYEAKFDDDFLIEYAIKERCDYVKQYCNISSIPSEMNTQIIKMIIGEFLYRKYLLGGADALGIQTIALISSWDEDDTSISFSSSNDTSMDALILAHIKNLRNGERVFLMRNRSVTKA